MDAVIGGRVVAWWQAHRFPVLGVYWPIRAEPDLRAAYAALAAAGARLALPTVAAAGAPLVFIAWEPGAPTVRDRFGVQVPAAGMPVNPDALLVPCVGFNDDNFRLGYGGGFYDRSLSAGPRPAAAGIAYASTRVAFEAETFDVALDLVITD